MNDIIFTITVLSATLSTAPNKIEAKNEFI